jgi:hypothetical protein
MARPDVLVYCGPRVSRMTRRCPIRPSLSRSSPRAPRRETTASKRECYFIVPSLAHYIIIDPDRPVVIHHKRGAANAVETELVTGARVQLDPPGLDIDLTEVLAS